MTAPRQLSDDVFVSGQIAPEDMKQASELGVTLIINNRPDGEETDQPTSAEIAAAAEIVGIAYVHAPAVGMPDPETVDAVGEALSRDHAGRTWMFCRSGMRSTAAWAMVTARSGALGAEEIRHSAARAGYDISRLPL